MQSIDAFSYLTVLFSIIIGLGIAHLLKAAAYVIHHRKTISIFIPTLLWWLTLLILHVQIWWSSFERRDVTDWEISKFAIFLTMPTLTYLASFVLIPEPEPNGNFNLEAIFFHNRRWFYGLMTLLPLASFLQEYLLYDTITYSLDAVFRVVFPLLSILGCLIANKRFHVWLSLILFILLLIYVILLFQKLK